MKKIAIIDDDIYIGNMLEELLQGNGTMFFVRTLEPKHYIFFHKISRIWFCWI